jgi:hypothetical protein
MARKPGPERAEMARHPKATSNDGMQKALQDVRAGPLQPPWLLSRKQKPVWDEILLAPVQPATGIGAHIDDVIDMLSLAPTAATSGMRLARRRRHGRLL